MNRETWLSARALGIGGSDASSIIGLNKFSTPFQVWLEKTGQVPPIEDNVYMKAGRKLEPVVADWFFEENPESMVITTEENCLAYHPIYSYILGSPDRQFIDDQGRLQVLEIKTTQNKIDLDFPPESWFTQAGYYAYILGYSHFTICVLERGLELKHKTYAVDVDYCEWVVQECVSFWNNHVLTGIPPEPVNADDVVKRYPTDSGEYMEADFEVVAQHSEIIKLTEQEKQISDAIDTIKTELKIRLGNSSGYVLENKALFTYKTSKDGVSLDTAKLKDEQPAVYNAYLKPKKGNRSFLVKPL